MTMTLRQTYVTPVGEFHEIELDAERSLRLILTGACNLACEFCAYKVKDFYSPEVHSDKLVEMRPTGKLKRLLGGMKRRLSYDIAHFTGGEPSIAKYLVGIAELCRTEGYSISMCSNLIFVEPVVKLVEKDLLDQLTFSYVPLDSGQQRSQLSSRQRPSEERIERTLANVLHLHSRFPHLVVKTNVVMSPYSNIEHTAEFIAWCWDTGVVPRVQRDRILDRISGSTDNTNKLLAKLRMEPKSVMLRIPGATEVCEFENPDGRVMYVKIFNKNFRPQEVCKLCNKKDGCGKSLSSIRIYDTRDEPIVCLCTVHNESFAHFTIERFFGGQPFEEIKAYKENRILYFNRFCRHPNFQ